MHEVHSAAFRIWRGGSTTKFRVLVVCFFLFFYRAIKCLNHKRTVNARYAQKAVDMECLVLK